MWSHLDAQRLSQIATQWSLIERAQVEAGDGARAAQLELLCRYGGAVYRYLRKVVQEQQAVEDLCQELALRLTSGRFGGLEPRRGRFRDFLKGVLFHLIADHRRRRATQPRVQPESQFLLQYCPARESPPDEEFVRLWREELLHCAWRTLESQQRPEGPPYHTALRCRVEHPDWRSEQLAADLTKRTGLPLTTAYVRQLLTRARKKFATALRQEVGRSLSGASSTDVTEEMRILGLERYCDSYDEFV